MSPVSNAVLKTLTLKVMMMVMMMMMMMMMAMIMMMIITITSKNLFRLAPGYSLQFKRSRDCPLKTAVYNIYFVSNVQFLLTSLISMSLN